MHHTDNGDRPIADCTPRKSQSWPLLRILAFSRRSACLSGEIKNAPLGAPDNPVSSILRYRFPYVKHLHHASRGVTSSHSHFPGVAGLAH